MLISHIMDLPEKTPCKILIVDDDSSILELLGGILDTLGFEWRSANDGAEAVQKLKIEDFDLVLTDMVMPHMDGMELLCHIRRFHPRTDVIVITGHPSTFSYTDVIQAGAIDFITKPFSIDELRAKIQRVQRERHIIEQLEILSLRDPLTGIYNRRYFDLKITEECQRGSRQGYRVFLAMIDVDRFKTFNDTHGHQAGDDLLRIIGKLLRLCSRKNVDWPFRYGGDEFALIIPQTTHRQAEHIIKRLLQRFVESDADICALSAGLAEFRPPVDRPLESAIISLIRRADQALYKAKESGGNQLHIHTD